MGNTTAPETIDQLIERLSRGEPLTPDGEPQWDPKTLEWTHEHLDALLEGLAEATGPFSTPIRNAYRGVIGSAETARRYLGTDQESVHFAGFCQALRFYDDHARGHQPPGGEISERYRHWREDLSARPVLRELTFDQWREMLKDAQPPTEDDVPWRFPVRTPLEEPAE